MMRLYTPLLSGVMLLLFSCSKPQVDEPVHSSLKQAPVITGIIMTDINGQPIGSIGSPNVNTGNSRTSKNFIFVYPNPCTDFLSVVINTDKLVTLKIWMVAGTYTDIGATANLNTQTFMSENISIPIDISMPSKIGSNVRTLNLTDVPNGFYRLYVEIGDLKLWDDIWINK